MYGHGEALYGKGALWNDAVDSVAAGEVLGELHCAGVFADEAEIRRACGFAGTETEELAAEFRHGGKFLARVDLSGLGYGFNARRPVYVRSRESDSPDNRIKVHNDRTSMQA